MTDSRNFTKYSECFGECRTEAIILHDEGWHIAQSSSTENVNGADKSTWDISHIHLRPEYVLQCSNNNESLHLHAFVLISSQKSVVCMKITILALFPKAPLSELCESCFCSCHVSALWYFDMPLFCALYVSVPISKPFYSCLSNSLCLCLGSFPVTFILLRLSSHLFTSHVDS